MKEDIKKLQRITAALTSLLEKPEPGLFTWSILLKNNLVEMRNLMDKLGIEPS